MKEQTEKAILEFCTQYTGGEAIPFQVGAKIRSLTDETNKATQEIEKTRQEIIQAKEAYVESIRMLVGAIRDATKQAEKNAKSSDRLGTILIIVTVFLGLVGILQATATWFHN